MMQKKKKKKKNPKAWKKTIREQRAGTLGNPEWRTMKGSSWEDFQPGKKESAYLRKMTRGKAAKSWVWKGWEALKEEGPQLFKATPEWKVSRRLLRKKHQKEKIMRNTEGTNHQGCWHYIGSGTQEGQMGGISGTLEP